jgi:predicted nucleic acid-binding protein
MADGGFLDTSVAVRYLVGDDPALAERAQRIIVGEVLLWLSDGTLAEIAHVLTRVYGIPRAAVVDELILLIRRPNVRLHSLDLSLSIQALQFCRPSGRVSFADALLWAAARSADATAIYSFDERFPADGLIIRRELEV